MDRREKTEFIEEQMRFLIALARLKDEEIGQEGKKDSIGGGEAEWVRVRVGGRKVNEEFLKDKANEVCQEDFILNGTLLTTHASSRISNSSTMT